MGNSARRCQYHPFPSSHTAAGPASSTAVPAESMAIPMESSNSSQHSPRDSHSCIGSLIWRKKSTSGTPICKMHSTTAKPPASLRTPDNSSPLPSREDLRIGIEPSPRCASMNSPSTGRITGSARSPVCPRFPVLLYSEKISSV